MNKPPIIKHKVFAAFILISTFGLHFCNIGYLIDEYISLMHTKFWFIYDLIHFTLYALWGVAFALLSIQSCNFRIKKTELFIGIFFFLYCLILILGQYFLITTGSRISYEFDFLKLWHQKSSSSAGLLVDLVYIMVGYFLTRGLYGESK